MSKKVSPKVTIKDSKIILSVKELVELIQLQTKNNLVEKSGIYQISIKQMSFFTDVQKESINDFINEFINEGKIKYDFVNNIIFIKNIFKFQKGMIKNKKVIFATMLRNYQIIKTDFWQDFFEIYKEDETIKEFIVTALNKEIKDFLINKTKKKPKTPKDPDNNDDNDNKFIRPTLQEVKDYCQERANNVDPEQFIDYYQANGWKVGKNPMKDWKASVRTWERKNKDTTTTTDFNKNKWNEYA